MWLPLPDGGTREFLLLLYFRLQKVGLPCNGSCPVGSFLCGEVCGEDDDVCVTNEFLSLHCPRFARMIQNKTSTETVKGFARSSKS